MELKDAVELAFQHGDAMQTFWNFYITVFLGIIAFLAAANLPAKRMRLVAWVITMGFVGFAVINFGALQTAAHQRIAAERLLRAMVSESGSAITKTQEFKYLVDAISRLRRGQ